MDLQVIKTILVVLTVVAGIVVVVGTPLISHLQKRIDARQEATYQQELNKQLNDSRDEMRELEAGAKADRKRLAGQLADVQDRLRPFEDLARSRYPDVAIEEALEKLRKDLEEVKELATRDTPKPPTDEVTRATLSALQVWRAENPSLRVALNLGNADTPHTEGVLKTVMQFLQKAGVPVEYRNRSGMTGGRNAPIGMRCAASRRASAEALKAALGNYIQGTAHVISPGGYSESEVEITLVGISKFYNDGRVVLE